MAKGSITWAIILRLQTQLQTITVANDYLTDIGTNVWVTDGQRTSDDALGLMIYSESIAGTGLDRERPAKAIREFNLLLECIIGTDLDDAQQQIHNVIEDIDRCIDRYTTAQAALQLGTDAVPMRVVDAAILDRPEGAAVIACQVRVAARYLR